MFAATVRKFWKPLAVIAALLFVYAQTLLKLAHDWRTDENYSHGLLAPFIIAYILWTERAELRRELSVDRASSRAVVAGGAACLFAFVLLWAGAAGAELFAQRASFVLMLAGVAVYFFGFVALRRLFAPLLLLALAIPIPAIIFNKIAFPLQLFASRCAVWAMQTCGIAALREGNIIELLPKGAARPKRLEVVEACSGIRSLMTLVTLAVLFAYFTRPRRALNSRDGSHSRNVARRLFLLRFDFWRAYLIVAFAVPVAIAMNALRVAMTGVLARFYGTSVADGFFHTFSGWAIYVAAAVLLFAAARLLDKLAEVKAGAPQANDAASNMDAGAPTNLASQPRAPLSVGSVE